MDDELWTRYEADRSIENRNRIVQEHIEFAHKIAWKIHLGLRVGQFEKEDLQAESIFGLIQAVEKFDRSKEVKFKTFAQSRIFGAVFDFVRKRSFIPRLQLEVLKRLKNARIDFFNEHQREPSDSELAELLGISLEEFSKLERQTPSTISLFQINVYKRSSTEDFETNWSNGAESNEPPVDENQEFLDLIRIACKGFSDQERFAFVSYLVHEQTMKAVGEKTGVSESRVSQMMGPLKERAKRNIRKFEEN